MVHWGTVGWPSQPNTEGLGHKPGSSVVASGGNPGKVDGGQGPAGTSSFGGTLGPLGVTYIGDGNEFPPPVRHINLVGPPFQPYLIILY